MRLRHLLAGAAMLAVSAGAASAATITIATVNNADMIVMQKLSAEVGEGDRHQAQLGGARGERAAPARHHRHRHQGRAVRRHHHRHLRDADLGQAGLARPDRRFPRRLRLRRHLQAGARRRSRPTASSTRCRSTPRARSRSIARTCSRRPGSRCPSKPTYDQIAQFADKLTDKAKRAVYGICLRGKPGWGENMAFVSTLVNTFGGRWFDMKWKPQLDHRPEWKKAVTFYVDLMKDDGPPGAARQRLQREPGAVLDRPLRDVDRRDGRRRHASSTREDSQVADKVGFAAGADRR